MCNNKLVNKFLKSDDQNICLRLSLYNISLIVIDKVYFYVFVAWWSALKVSAGEDQVSDEKSHIFVTLLIIFKIDDIL